MFEEVNQISVITLAGATELSQSLANVVNEVFKRKAERHEDLAKYNNNEIYTEELEMLRADDKVDDYILRTNVELVSKMLQSFNS